MAVSLIGGDMGFVTQVPVILKEGNITVNTSAYGPFGKEVVCTLASEINQGDVVSISADTENTYEATGGNFVVTLPATNVDLAVGRVIDEPKWVRKPATSQSTWANMLAGEYYRIATVELFVPMSIFQATLVCADATAITPGEVGKLDIDASASLAIHGISLVDVASDGATTIIPLTYAAKSDAATEFSLLIGTIGLGTVTA